MAASHFITLSRPTPLSTLIPPPQTKIPLILLNFTDRSRGNGRTRGRSLRIVRVSDGRDSSYLDMWKKAVDRERDEIEFQKIVDNSGKISETEETVDPDALAKKSDEFQKILEVSKEERDRVQRMQVIDRAAAAIAAAKALLKDTNLRKEEGEGSSGIDNLKSENKEGMGDQQEAMKSGNSFVSQSVTSSKATPGPDFWAWTPPEIDRISDDIIDATQAKMPSPYPTTVKPVMEKERYVDTLSIPFERKFPETNPPLPPLQSFMEVENVDISTSLQTPSSQEEHELGVKFSSHAAEAVRALNKVDEASSYGVYPDGSRWWKETGIERRPDGVVCKWTLTRGVSTDQGVEWEEKFWEAADEFQYKELGSEKSGRDATGNVWREYWKESMFQDYGIMNLEKTADKWGKNGKGDEWHEKWWEHYDASGKADKWADKWSCIDPNTPLEAGHAHVWHERWGEKYDGFGSSIKYTDKWAERSEGDGWTKWGDKWDENFNVNGHGVKQGETWWEGKYGERWNRTWGEGHNGSGWVHKYGKSSSGEHWDTHVEQETWYERYPHFGFMHCFDNSVQLREVRKPSETETS